MKKLFSYSLIMVLAFVTLAPAVHAQASGSLALHGWAWSWTTGWIKLSSKQTDSSGQPLATDDPNPAGGAPVVYGVSFDETTGAGSGWAWSPNVGWISFNEADLSKGLSMACKGPNGGSAIPAKLSVDGTGYKLTGTARAISPTQVSNGWNLLSANGNWNGCIYFDSASLPSNPCNVPFGVKFVPLAGLLNTYSGQGQAWNAAGNLNPPVGCSSPLGFGGLSFIEFAGTFKSVLKQNTPSLTASISLASGGWDSTCKDVASAQFIQKSLTVNYSVAPIANTTCTWSFDGQTSSVSLTAPLTKTFTFTPTSAGVPLLSMTCTNAGTQPTTTTATLSPVSCSQCSDGKDNETPVGDGLVDDKDHACHAKCSLSEDYTPNVNSEIGGLNGNNNCAAGSKLKGIPSLKEN